ncbi:MAG: preprotein translocase subunit YajC [Verrucomicrobia bacterium]|nr:MAG: preprotein translocase subunit YajC [Verrucomicrobiota bacterium]
MNLMGLNTVLATGAPIQLAQQPAPAWNMTGLVPIILMGVVIYFALFRPQQQKQKQHAALLKTIQKGDKILTNGGIIAEVITVKQETLMVRSADSKFEIARNAVAQITERSGAAPSAA